MMRPPIPQWTNTSAPTEQRRYPVAIAHRSASGSMLAVQTDLPASVLLTGCVLLGVGFGVGFALAERRPAR